MSDNLKPCPFCGGMPYFYQIYAHGGKVWKVMCPGRDGRRVDCLTFFFSSVIIGAI